MLRKILIILSLSFSSVFANDAMDLAKEKSTDKNQLFIPALVSLGIIYLIPYLAHDHWVNKKINDNNAKYQSLKTQVDYLQKQLNAQTGILPVLSHQTEQNTPQDCNHRYAMSDDNDTSINNLVIKKPIIYLYPERDDTLVNIHLDYKGKLTVVYPEFNAMKEWQVRASTNGNLIDTRDNKAYYALYWEGIPDKTISITTGHVVKREDTIAFLENSLFLLGLNARERNEMIIYWLPILLNNKYNLIYFAGDDYLETAQLIVSPKPKTVIRVMMVFQGLDAPVTIKSQSLPKAPIKREGFTLVEWGGMDVDNQIMK